MCRFGDQFHQRPADVWPAEVETADQLARPSYFPGKRRVRGIVFLDHGGILLSCPARLWQPVL
uniref:Uncharacterized protein n=1 Tax=Rhizobium rhizogenes TaxID=359 RepID=A0A2Z2PN44_RHIRH|nr:hypothetical protein [Rhizobium rhizogenes]